MNRIAELLQTDYRNFNDSIVVESTFAQVNRNGKGIRQVQLALTDTKFIVATDIFWRPPSNERCWNREQPTHVSLELNRIVPLNLVKFRVYIRANRFILKVVYCTSRVMFFEIGGFINRHLDWLVWKNCVDDIRIRQARKICTKNASHSSDVSSDMDLVNGSRSFQCKAEVHKSSARSFRQNIAKHTNNSMLTQNFDNDIAENKKRLLLDLCKDLVMRRTLTKTSTLNMKDTIR